MFDQVANTFEMKLNRVQVLIVLLNSKGRVPRVLKAKRMPHGITQTQLPKTLPSQKTGKYNSLKTQALICPTERKLQRLELDPRLNRMLFLEHRHVFQF